MGGVSTPVHTLVCPSCQAPYEVETNFCGNCGSDVRRAIDPAGSSTSQRIDKWIGRLIDSRYRVLLRIGHGGMGVVYKVEHQRMGKIAAMKVLHQELASDREVVKRFRREAEAVSKLTHPNTVQTFDFGSYDGSLYLVMEYVKGEDLAAILRRDGPFPFGRAATLFIQACGALSEAHELGIVHRDLKPENLLVTRTRGGRDHVKVLDFGLAKLSEREDAAEVTGRGAIVGTPYYMSPEQIRGEMLDHRSDIYSMGAMLYRIVTGEHPFTAQTPVGVLTKHLTDEVVPPSRRRPDLSIDPRVDDVILRAMAKKREDRYATVDGVREDLETAREAIGGVPSQEIWEQGSGRRSSPPPASASSSTRPRARTPSSPSSSSPSAAAAVAVTAVQLEAPERRDADRGEPAKVLRREDFDAYERSLKRRAFLRMLAIPLLLAGVAGGAFAWVRWRGQQPHEVEVEPNNDLEKATRVAPGLPVRGKIAQRLDDSTSDRDYYRMTLPPGRTRLSTRVTAIRNIDLLLVVFDRSGRLLATGDNGAVGDAETIPNLGVDGDEIYLAVRESAEGAAGRLPTENITDEYQLVVDVSPPVADEELEPNDTDSDATPIAAGKPVRGYMGRIRDVDRFRFAGPAGEYEVQVTGADTVPVKMRAGETPAKAGRSLVVHLEVGTILSIERDDPERAPRPIAPAADQPYSLHVKKR
jgi:eukaryotic-like serine/threonine-protein kinase